MLFQNITFNANAIREQLLEGQEYLVVPCVMITNGVHKGSHGSLYYPEDELKKSVIVWNHKPVLIRHPSSGSTACTKAIMDEQKVGIILNAKYSDKKLKAEAWMNPDRLKTVDKDVLETLKKAEPVECSTGLFLDAEASEGIFNHKNYTAIARNLRPDHLAILPDEVGACSIKDGCGLAVANCGSLEEFFNQRKLKMPKETMLGRPTINFGKEEKKDEGPKVIPHPTANESPLGRPSLDMEPDISIKRPGVRGEEPLGRPKLTF